MRAERKTTVERIAVVRPGALGDTLLLAPVLRGLREAECGTFCGTMPQARMLQEWGVVSNALDYELEDARHPCGRTDEKSVVVFMRGDERLEREYRAAGFRDVFFVEPLPQDGGEHVIDYLARRLGECGLESKPGGEPFETPSGRPAGGFREGGVVIVPGSGSKAKNWPVGCFAEVAREFEGKWREVFWLLGHVEEERGLGRELPDGSRVLSGLSLGDAANTLAGASLVVGNDSGPVHLAALLGVPAVAVFQASSPETWTPRGLWTRAVGKRGAPPEPAEVVRAVRELLDAASQRS